MIAIWVLLGILTRLEAAWVSSLRPLTPMEQAMPAWPPGSPFWAWLERVLIAPWARWDALGYARIVEQGYRAGDGTTQFYPLYPLLATPLARLGLPPMVALTLVGLVAGLGAILRFEEIAWEEMDPRQAREATLAFMLFPIGFILFAPYAEALFLLCAIESIGATRQGQWGARRPRGRPGGPHASPGALFGAASALVGVAAAGRSSRPRASVADPHRSDRLAQLPDPGYRRLPPAGARFQRLHICLASLPPRQLSGPDAGLPLAVGCHRTGPLEAMDGTGRGPGR